MRDRAKALHAIARLEVAAGQIWGRASDGRRYLRADRYRKRKVGCCILALVFRHLRKLGPIMGPWEAQSWAHGGPNLYICIFVYMCFLFFVIIMLFYFVCNLVFV
mgnify:CR=1 FL=1